MATARRTKSRRAADKRAGRNSRRGKTPAATAAPRRQVAIDFARVLRDTRVYKGLTQREASALIGIDLAHWSRLENARPEAPVTAAKIRHISQALELSNAER